MLDQVPILLADDDQNDVFLMRRAFQGAGFLNPLVCVQNGQEVVVERVPPPITLVVPMLPSPGVVHWPKSEIPIRLLLKLFGVGSVR